LGKKEAAERRLPCRSARAEVIFQQGRDAGEFGVQRAAETVDHGDDGNRDAGGDQTVFDGGGAGFILQKRDNLGHETLQV
jgi:hypothetical protein